MANDKTRSKRGPRRERVNMIPHSFVFFLVAHLLDCRYLFVLLFGLGIDKAVTKVDFTETFGLFSQVCFADASEL